jgi:hypothetical protein
LSDPAQEQIDAPGRSKKDEPLIDRYRILLDRLDSQTVARKQRMIEDQLWHGSPGSPPIFGDELKMVRDRNRREERPDLLILCVGYSPEPLLLAVAHHAPVEVLLLLENGLQQDYLDSLERLWDRYCGDLGLPPFDKLEKDKVQGSAAALFLAVRKIVEDRQWDSKIILDITGAKKSMIAGAFLAASFLDLKTSYVDFEEYDPVLRRPVPGTSRPGHLQHPYGLFKLREEARLEEEFNRRRFREAGRLAKTLREMAESPEVKELLAHEATDWAARYSAVQRVSAAYARWSEGFYREEEKKDNEPSDWSEVPLPASVERLRQTWPSASDSPKDIVKALSPQAVFADPSTPLAYFLDVLVWNNEERLADRPREVFLRLYGTLESVISFAFHAFVSRCPECLQVPSPAPGEWDEARIVELRRRAVDLCEKSSTQALKVLRGKRLEISPDVEESSAGDPEESGTGTVSLAAPVFPREVDGNLFKGKGGAASLFSFSELRHKAVHWLAPVPEDMARRLLQYYRTVLKELVPLVVAHLREDATDLDPAARERLDDWERRLLEAADGRIPEDCKPLLYRQVRDLVSAV